MPDDIILCPSCNRKLRMAEIHQGQIVQCPLCSVIFRTPVRAQPPGAAPSATPPAGPGDTLTVPPPKPIEPQVGPVEPIPAGGGTGLPVIDVRRAVLLPGISLIVCGVLSGIGVILGLQGILATSPDGLIRLMEERGGPEIAQQATVLVSPQQLYGITLGIFIALLLSAVGTVLGGVQMLRLERYWLAMTGSILACFNLISLMSVGVLPCCLFTAPLTVWSVTVLRLPEVRSAFNAPLEPEAEETDPE